MSSFVLMLGIASVLEACQHLLWIKADAKVARGETTSVDATWDARQHCNEMDDGFEFLCKLYHCKYRGKHRQKTRYEELKGKTTRIQEQVFADRIYEIVDRNGEFSASPSRATERLLVTSRHSWVFGEHILLLALTLLTSSLLPPSPSHILSISDQNTKNQHDTRSPNRYLQAKHEKKANKVCVLGGYLLRRENLIVNNMQDNNHASRLVARFLVELMGLTQSSP
jgi:hypothetical protein